ncbi:unnamed protein product [Pedinophyceae sp. YPF-701]|nr:unnamed protein product [Pedinophyceae sp. YPF-701]
MKLRIRTPSGQTVRIAVENDSTISTLHAAVASEVLGGVDVDQVQLSLNKKDVIAADEPGTPLSALDIHSGDLLFVLGGDSTATASQASRAEAAPPVPAVAEVTAPGQAMEVDTSDGEASAPPRGVARCDTPSQRTLPLHHSWTAGVQHGRVVDALCLLLHAALLESGFRPSRDAPAEAPLSWLPTTSQSLAGSYAYPVAGLEGAAEGAADVPCAIRGTCLGPQALLAVSVGAEGAATGGGASGVLRLPLAALQAPAVAGGAGWAALARRPEEAIAEVRRVAREAVCVCCRVAGVTPPFSITHLPADVKGLILSFMDYPELCRMSCTCREMEIRASDDALWQPLFTRHFGASSISIHQRDVARRYGWKRLFRQEVEEQRRRARAADTLRRRAVGGVPPPAPLPHGPPFPLGPVPQPGVIGGDYDLMPGGGFGALGGGPLGGGMGAFGGPGGLGGRLGGRMGGRRGPPGLGGGLGSGLPF